jgi:hypothetical protein
MPNPKIHTFTFMLLDPEFDSKITREHTLFLNPEDVTRHRPAKSSVTLTPAGAFLTDFGLALPTWSLRGHTGWRTRTVGGIPRDGYWAWNELVNIFLEYSETNQARSTWTGEHLYRPMELHFHAWDEDDHWQIHPLPTGLPTLHRNNVKPLYRYYDIQFTGLKELGAAEKQDPDGIAESLLDADHERAALLDAAMDGVIVKLQWDLTHGQVNMQSPLGQQWSEFISDIQSLQADLHATVQGAREFIATPFSVVNELILTSRNLCNEFQQLAEIPFTTIYNLHAMLCQLQVLALYPYWFWQTLLGNLDTIRQMFQDSGCATTLPSRIPGGFLR